MGAKVTPDSHSFLTGQSLFGALSIVVAVSVFLIESLLGGDGSQVTLLIPTIASAIVVGVVGIWAIPFLQALKTGQFIREEGPKAHFAKAGTPTMGGLFFVPTAVAIALIGTAFSPNVLAVAAMTLAYGLIGWLDDWQVIRRKSNKGITPRVKLALQILVACSFCGWLYTSSPESITLIRFPFGIVLPLGILFWPLAIFTPVAQSNATNLTDGLDGLAAGTGAIVFIGLAGLTISEYPDLALFSACMAGGCLGFLAHNRNPASVFMGDTGSLALGGAMAAVGLLSNNLFGLLILSGVFLIETLSVMAQVVYFKATKDEKGIGKRLFKMAPFHHHLELSGWSEILVVGFFYALSGMLAIATLAVMELRT